MFFHSFLFDSSRANRAISSLLVMFRDFVVAISVQSSMAWDTIWFVVNSSKSRNLAIVSCTSFGTLTEIDTYSFFINVIA